MYVPSSGALLDAIDALWADNPVHCLTIPLLQAQVISVDVQAGNPDRAAQQEERTRRILVGHSLGAACAAAEVIDSPEVRALISSLSRCAQCRISASPFLQAKHHSLACALSYIAVTLDSARQLPVLSCTPLALIAMCWIWPRKPEQRKGWASACTVCSLTFTLDIDLTHAGD